MLLITYDLEVNDDYEAVIVAIDRLGPAVEIQRSVWIVASDLDPDAAFNHVAQELLSDDRLFVGPLARGSKWRNAICGSDALKTVFAQGRS